jgi:hypothetical protein
MQNIVIAEEKSKMIMETAVHFSQCIREECMYCEYKTMNATLE